jgi:hypothetical protein
MLSSKITDYYFSLINPTINFPPGYLKVLPFIIDDENKNTVDILVKQNIKHAKNDWDSFEKSWDFTKHPLAKISNNRLLSEVYNQWENKAKNRFNEVKINEEKINKIFIDIFNLKYELTPSVKERDIMISKADIKRDIISFFSYAVGCMFGRYSLDVEGLAYAGGEWKVENYQTFIPDKDNIIPITDEEYFKDDIVGLFVKFVKQVYGEATLEENLDFIADSLGKKGNSSREIIRNYFIKDFFNDHCKTYSVKGSGKRPIYWLFDSGKQDGFKALIYLHRYDENTIGNLRIDYLHKMQRIYENEIARMRDTIENSGDNREVAAATKRKEKLIKQLQETKAYDEKIAHLALSRIAIDLDDGVKANYEKIQTGTDGKKLAVLAKI